LKEGNIQEEKWKEKLSAAGEHQRRKSGAKKDPAGAMQRKDDEGKSENSQGESCGDKQKKIGRCWATRRCHRENWARKRGRTKTRRRAGEKKKEDNKTKKGVRQHSWGTHSKDRYGSKEKKSRQRKVKHKKNGKMCRRKESQKGEGGGQKKIHSLIVTAAERARRGTRQCALVPQTTENKSKGSTRQKKAREENRRAKGAADLIYAVKKGTEARPGKGKFQRARLLQNEN